MRSGDAVAGMEEYLNARAHLDVVLRSFPQAVFQSFVYVLGSSRGTRIYVDERIFVPSIAFSMFSLCVYLGTMLREALQRGENVLLVFWRRPRKMRTITLYTRVLDAREGEEMLEAEKGDDAFEYA
ncbi:hypothetical protein KFL_000030580 [Klebsormidium nitens]|uniref:Uncharacterized protein n=1 Tax=Klebsormidium nitens TaxID=105231 RepID=A0A1Y1HJQ6_KLENI|nr:hypothetical protein KFL_000030580 [Klebsormidium nitens]|eukprot:GAQ77782.1 hypothetical protein KFL_000030580 [Klebsormidium nitens]